MSAGEARSSALELHKQRATKLRTALLQRLFDLKLQFSVSEWPASNIIEKKLVRLEAVLKLDAELEQLALAREKEAPRRRGRAQ